MQVQGLRAEGSGFVETEGPGRGPPHSIDGVSTQGPSWGYLKVIFSETLSTFGDKCPQNGSKNGSTAPRTGLGYPHIGPFVGRVRCRANSVHERQSRPESGLGFQVKVLKISKLSPCSLGRGGDHGGVRPFRQKSTCLTALGPDVVQIWSRNPPKYE